MSDSDLELLRIVVSFMVGGCFVAAVTLISERIGGTLGGLISGLPGPMAISLFFQALLVGEARLAAEVAPLSLVSMGIFGYFVVAYIFCLRWGRVAGMLGALLCWAGLASLVSFLPVHSVALGALMCAVLGGFSYALLCLMDQADALGRALKAPKISFGQVGLRFILGGAAVMISVAANTFVSAKWGGLLSGLPAVAFSSLLILSVTMGADYMHVFAKNFVLSGVLNVGFYIVLVSLFYPLFGVWVGTVLAFCGALMVGYLLYKIKQSGLRVKETA